VYGGVFSLDPGNSLLPVGLVWQPGFYFLIIYMRILFEKCFWLPDTSASFILKN
jgi:hypothetical protein